MIGLSWLSGTYREYLPKKDVNFQALPKVAPPSPPIRATWSFFPDVNTKKNDDDNIDYPNIWLIWLFGCAPKTWSSEVSLKRALKM